MFALQFSVGYLIFHMEEPLKHLVISQFHDDLFPFKSKKLFICLENEIGSREATWTRHQ